MNIRDVVLRIKTELMSEGGELENACYRWIQKACRENSGAEFEVIDSGYDVSSFGRKTGDAIDVSAFSTIEDFLDYPTGESVPTFMSGAGMAAQTYSDLLGEFIRDQIWDWLDRNDLKSFVTDEEGLVNDDFCDISCENEADSYDFLAYLSKKPFPALRAV